VSAQAEACGYRKTPFERSLVAIHLILKESWSAPETGMGRVYIIKTG
jgi:hypothetical protein